MSVADAFRSFLGNIKITNGLTISARYGEITAALNKKFRDTESKIANSLQVGSYGRHTAIKGVSDLDMLYIMPAKTWNDYKDGGQYRLLSDCAAAIKARYPSTTVKVDRLVVRVLYSNFHIEVQPVFEQSDNSYKYPDSYKDGSWKITKPRDELKAMMEFNAQKNDNLRRLARMARAWKNKHGVAMGGLLIDTLAYNFLKQMGWMAPAPTDGISMPRCGCCQSSSHAHAGAIPMEITTVGIDLAKSIFQVHAVDAVGHVVVRKALRRAQVVPFFAKLPRCLVGMEACGTAHHWARELMSLGHDVRLMPPAYVKPYVKRGKTDANDAAAICEAVTRPSMRFVPVKSTDQQAALALHRTRDLLVKQRTQLVNMIRGLLAEFGIEMARGLRHALELAARLSAGDAAEVPPLAQRVVTGLADQIGAVQIQLTRLEKELLAWHRDSDLSQRLATIPGVGIVSATALAASVSEPERFRSGRQFAASLGLTPLQNCSGGKERLGRISRMGDRYLRRLLVVGMTSLIRRAKATPTSVDPRLPALLQRKPVRVVTVAAANRTARVAWAIMTRGGTYRAPLAAAA